MRFIENFGKPRKTLEERHTVYVWFNLVGNGALLLFILPWERIAKNWLGGGNTDQESTFMNINHDYVSILLSLFLFGFCGVYFLIAVCGSLRVLIDRYVEGKL